MERFTSKTTGYWHRQRAPLCLILYGFALATIVLAAVLSKTPGEFAFVAGIGLLVALPGPAFHHLTVQDEGESLAVRFGPVPVFKRVVPYREIEQVEVGRTTILDGWGIHFSLRGGWVWNLWGFDCVVVHLRKGILRIGTDDPEGLAQFLESKI